MTNLHFAYQVRVLSGIPKTLSYAAASALQTGQRVRVPLGNRQAVGIVLEAAEWQDSLKLAEPIESEPVFDALSLKTVVWAADYYFAPLQSMLAAALPKNGQLGKPLPETPPVWVQWQGDAPSARSHAQRALYDATRQATPWEHALTLHPSLPRKLLRAGTLKSVKPPTEALAAKGPQPTAEQQAALDAIDKPGTYLLEGITGSGKTEVYLRLAEGVLKRERQVLVLVPEIGLTPQLVDRFEKRFPGQVVHLHSALSDGARWLGWWQIASAQKTVLIGTRSALLAAVPKLGLVIVDEEHDGSYKQADAPRYHARDLAVVRGAQAQVPVVLGTATPALETLANAQAGRYQWVRLTHRATRATLPSARLLDLRDRRLHEGLSDEALSAIQNTLGRGEQALVFLNRRGFAPLLTCDHCGYTPECSQCDVKPTVHKQPQVLWCHGCDSKSPWPTRCPTCQNRLRLVGHGTQRLEEALDNAFPQFPVIRIDRDTAGPRGAGHLLEVARDAQPRVFVGTQMLAKGHDLPRLTLVVVVNADGQLFSGDFRGVERLSQTLVQVMGRAGRAELPGEVLVQTYQPDHPIWTPLLAGDYRAVAQQELDLRNHAGLPPYGHLALWRARSTEPGAALAHLDEVRGHYAVLDDVEVLGPAPAPVEKRAGQYNAQLLIKTTDRKRLRQLLSTPIPPAPRGLWRGLDMDPQDLF